MHRYIIIFLQTKFLENIFISSDYKIHLSYPKVFTFKKVYSFIFASLSILFGICLLVLVLFKNSAKALLIMGDELNTYS